MVRKRILVIGGGVNGLVHAFYQARAGHHVTLLERMDEGRIGGAARSAHAEVRGRRLKYPLGATLLGQMQRFIYEDMGLHTALRSGASPHPSMYRFEGQKEPFFFHHDGHRTSALAERLGWDLHGLEEFWRDEARVVAYLQEGFREGQPPSLTEARARFGNGFVRRWMTGSARDLLEHYFRDPRLQVVLGKDVVESGPVPFSAPGTAFTVPLLDAGSVFGGRWGVVEGGMGRLMQAMAAACRKAGATIVAPARVFRVDARKGECRSVAGGQERKDAFDHVTFATDPVTAARLLGGLDDLIGVTKKKYAGSSGKLILLFREPVAWKDDTGEAGFDAALKFFLHQRSTDEIDAASERVESGEAFVPGYAEAYCEGAGLRHIGRGRDYDSVMIFVKHLAHGRRGEELPDVREHVKRQVLQHTRNGHESIVFERLLTPCDLTEEFGFPQGNIDHLQLSTGQNAWDRTWAAPGSEWFYQFGAHGNASYCGAGAYPCGSVSGTAGYMCFRELERRFKPS